MGDYNINLFNVDKHKLTSDFLDLMYSYSYMPLITKPTRVSSKTATLIDNIYCNSFEKSVSQGILFSDISDHFPIFCIQNCHINEKNTYVTRRQITDTNILAFCTSLRTIDWNSVLQNENCQEAYTDFHNKFVTLYGKHFPLKSFKINYRSRKTWLTKGLKKSIKHKNKLYVPFLKMSTLSNKNAYKEYKRFLQKILRQAERNYYQSLLYENRNHLRKSWNIIKQIINRNKRQSVSDSFLLDGKIVSDKNVISGSFNKFFVNVGANLAKNIPSTNLDPTSYISGENASSMFLLPTDSHEVQKIVSGLKQASPGWDDISSRVIKESCDSYLTPLTHIFNLSLSQGIVPEELKVAKVIPLYKADDETVISNYRPVSVLPVFSKILERLVQIRLNAFIEKFNILYQYQFGFRKGHSTNTALIVLTEKITQAIEKGEMVLGVFLDFSKAFDTVNHTILLEKLTKYGIRGTARKWLANYLENRKQYVSWQGHNSSQCKITCGVPQGSILGPILFLLYINDLPNVSQLLLPLLFADDTNVFLSGKDVKDLIDTMNDELDKVVIWLQVNKLSLNIKKTHYIIFRSRRKTVKNHDNLCINGQEIYPVKSTKFLGVVIDEHLLWYGHINIIKSKVSKCIGILGKARKFVNKATLLTLYYTFMFPYFSYCVEVWGGTSECYISILFKLQKKAIRMITFSRYNAHTSSLFKELMVLPLQSIYIYNVMLFMFKYNQNLLPKLALFNAMFVKNKDIHEYNTRQTENLHVPPGKFATLKTIRHTGINLWNNISMNIMSSNISLSIFKSNLRKYLLHNLGSLII